MVSRRSLYTMALARQVSPDIVHAVVMDKHQQQSQSQNDGDNDNDVGVSLKLAMEQHAVYLKTMRSILPTICLPPLTNHPDGVFVEDTMVWIPNHHHHYHNNNNNNNGKGVVLMTRPGHESRRGEVSSMMELVQQLGYGTDDGSLYNMADIDPEATLDGGDVLYTGRHIYVGISSRTNERGFNVLKDIVMKQTKTDDDHLHDHDHADAPLKVIPVPMPNHNKNDNNNNNNNNNSNNKDAVVDDAVAALHLKSVITCLDDETLLAPPTALGHEVLTNMLDSGGYETIFVPSMLACNVVVVNGHVLVQAGGGKNDTSIVCQESKDILQKACQERNLKVHWVDTSELAKVDGALTCCSVLLQC